MKDITLTARRQKIELWWLLGAFVVANLFNLRAVMQYGAPWKEMYTSIFYVIIFALALYVLSVIIRLGVYGIYRLFKK